MADIKPEIKPEIKLDPADSPNTKMADIDEFDEALDLHMPSQEEQALGAWLVKVSEDLWKVWNDMYQNHNGDTPIQVGKLRVYHQKEGEKSQKVQIHLNKDHSPHLLLPQTYNLEMAEAGYNNTVVFSEKDLPGHRAQQFGGPRNFNGPRPSGLQPKGDRYAQKKPGTYRTAIPKQTALMPPIVNEAIAKPVEDDSAMDFFKRSYDAAMNAGKKTTFINSVKKVKQASSTHNFTFGTLTSKPAGNKKKVAKEKAVRMSQSDLLDSLQACFKRYEYWSLRTLRAELKQPEAWLKEVLEIIAVPMRSGDFAGNYRLTDDSKRVLHISAQQEVAPDLHMSDQGSGDELGAQDDDDADEFEDVEFTKDE